MDFDLASRLKPALATEDDILMDGLTETSAISLYGYRSACFVANLNQLVDFANVAWTMTESDDGASFSAVDADNLLAYRPSSGSSRVHLVGYRGKKPYVKAALDVGGTAAAAAARTSGTVITGAVLTRSGTTVTGVKVAHGVVVGQYITVAGAVETAYNGTFRVVTTADADTFTYTALTTPSASPATGTILITPHTYWTGNPGADIPASFTPGANAQVGTYLLTALDIGSSAASVKAAKSTNSGDGTNTISNINAAGAAAIVNEVITLRCTAAAANAGTFTAYRADGTALTPTIPVGATGATIQVGGVNAFKSVITDGAADWVLGDEWYVKITDLGVNGFKLTAPDGNVVGYPIGGTAFSTGEHLTFTIPDTTVAVSVAGAVLSIPTTGGLVRGQIMAVLGNPLVMPAEVASQLEAQTDWPVG